MEWIKLIIEKHTKEDGTFDAVAANKEIDQAFPDNAVPKDQYNNLSSNLKEAKATIKTLESATKDNPEVQKELESYKSKTTELEAENTKLKVNGQVESALRAAGAKDVEYATFKLGELELDKDGKVKDLDNKIKDLQANLPDYFQTKSEDNGDDGKTPPEGFKRVENDLKDGKNTEQDATQAMIEAMTADLPSPAAK